MDIYVHPATNFVNERDCKGNGKEGRFQYLAGNYYPIVSKTLFSFSNSPIFA